MKIRLILLKNSSHREIKTLQQVKKDEEAFINKNTYSVIRALERIEEFATLVRQIRDKFNIPESGYELEECERSEQSHKSTQLSSTFLKKLEYESMRTIGKHIKLYPMIAYSLSDIVLFNCVFIPLEKIFIENRYTILPSYSRSATKIVVNSNVSKRQLLRYVNSHFPEIKKSLKHIGTDIEFYISERDFKIIDLHDRKRKKLKFSEIADILKEFDITGSGKINEDSVKKAYNEAKKKINSLLRHSQKSP